MVRIVLMLASLVSLVPAQSKFIKTYDTPTVRVRYQKSVSLREVKKMTVALDSAVARISRQLDIPLGHKLEVQLEDSRKQLRNDTRSPFFDDAVFKAGRIFIVPLKAFDDDGKAQDAVSRVVARAILSQLQFCPVWLIEAYSLYAGNALGRFNQPSRANILTFHDLSEDYSRAEREEDQKEIYAKLGATIGFLVNRYGEGKVQGMFVQFKPGVSLEDVFESTFGENIAVIEQAWVKAITPQRK